MTVDTVTKGGWHICCFWHAWIHRSMKKTS